MNTQFFSKSKDFRQEYACSIVRIGELQPIEGKDRIVSTLVNGLSMVVRKDQVKEGDIMFYAMNETQLSEKFLSKNNLFDINWYEKNSNAVEVGKLLFENKKDDAKQHCGFFNKYGRVKLIKLGGIPSYGYLFSINELAAVYPGVSSVNLEELIGTDFDTICGEEFIKVYVPQIKGKKKNVKESNRDRKLFRFDRLIPGKFQFHYDTSQLGRNIDKIRPIDSVIISNKIHGTSAIFANVLTKKPKFGFIYKKIFCYLPKFLQFYTEDYDFIYSSRSVIKNKYINNKVNDGYYGSDIWGEYAKRLENKIPKGMTIYGEIFGYVSNENKMIQKGYDYGCPVGTNKLMIYRITSENEDGSKREWEVQEVYDWTIKFVNENPDLEKYIRPIDILYKGTLGDLYPELNIQNHWNENVLEALKNDKKHFGMELNEPLCKNKVPREGFVLRINNDTVAEAFKLKCNKFMMKESEDISNGIVDIEIENSYSK